MDRAEDQLIFQDEPGRGDHLGADLGERGPGGDAGVQRVRVAAGRRRQGDGRGRAVGDAADRGMPGDGAHRGTSAVQTFGSAVETNVKPAATGAE